MNMQMCKKIKGSKISKKILLCWKEFSKIFIKSLNKLMIFKYNIRNKYI
jgi:hypothetical protein